VIPGYLSTLEAARYLGRGGCAHPCEAALVWMKRHGVPLEYIGRRRGVRQVSLDEAIKRSGRTKRLQLRRIA